MRNKSGAYFMGREADSKLGWLPRLDCYFEINFDAMKSIMNSKAFDYWKFGPKHKEQEERFWSNVPYIENVKKYINSIHVFVTEKNKDELSKLNHLAKKRDIPIFFYDKPQNYILGRLPIEYTDRDWSINFKTSVKEVESIIKMFNDDKLTGSEVKFLKALVEYSWSNKDTANYIENWLHRSMKTDEKNSRELGRNFTELMRKNKKKNVLSFIEDVVVKKVKDKFGIKR